MSHHSHDKSLADVMAIFGNKPEVVKDLAQQTKLGDPTEERLTRYNAVEEQLKDTLGPTNDFPHGRLVPHDEGGLMFGVTVFNGRVIFDFGKPIRSIGFTREGALELAELIKQRAMDCPPILFPKG